MHHDLAARGRGFDGEGAGESYFVFHEGAVAHPETKGAAGTQWREFVLARMNEEQLCPGFGKRAADDTAFALGFDVRVTADDDAEFLMRAAEVELEIAVGARRFAWAAAIRDRGQPHSPARTGRAWRAACEFGGGFPAVGRLNDTVFRAPENNFDLVVGVGGATTDAPAQDRRHRHGHEGKIVRPGLAGDLVGARVVLDGGDPAVALGGRQLHRRDDGGIGRTGVECGGGDEAKEERRFHAGGSTRKRRRLTETSRAPPSRRPRAGCRG